MREKLTKFELNTATLEDFDSLMSKHLDQVEELYIRDIENKSKILNVVGLCINLNTIIIEGDERTNVNSIISSICKPELIQNLILNGVKIPTAISLKKLTSLRMVSLNNIRGSNVKLALDNIVAPEKIEALNFEQVDFAKNSINCIEKFQNLKFLNLIKVKNCKLDNLRFLSEMSSLERINIEKNIIKFNEIGHIMKCKFNKKILVDLPTRKNEVITNCLEILENGKVLLTINSKDLEEVIHYLDLAKVDNIITIISGKNNLTKYIKKLKKVKGKVSIAIKDCSCLSVNDANELKNELNLKFVNIIDFDGTLQYEKNRYCYEIDKYIKIRTELQKIVEQINSESDELVKFLQVYKIIGENIEYDEFEEQELTEYYRKNKNKNSNLENGLLKKSCSASGFAEILKNTLACIGIDSKIIRGNLVGIGKEHIWNQVKISDKWYNVDIGLDSKRINNNKKNLKPMYCLISDKAFGKTHIPKIANTEYCPESLNRKIIEAYFKKDFNVKQQIEYIIQKIKSIFIYNIQKALPEGKKGNHEK